MGSVARLPHRETLSIAAVKPHAAEGMWPVLWLRPSEAKEGAVGDAGGAQWGVLHGDAASLLPPSPTPSWLVKATKSGVPLLLAVVAPTLASGLCSL